MSVNAPADEYDIATNRVLIPDCDNDALLTMDAATGEIGTLIEKLPYSSDHFACLHTPMVEPQGGRAYAVFDYAYDDPNDIDDVCSTSDLVSIDTATGAMTTVQNIWTICCEDGCGGSEGYSSIQLDAAHDRLLYLESDCDGDWCDYHLSAMPLGGGPNQRLRALYPDSCFPDEGCEAGMTTPMTIAPDPAAADDRVLVLVTSSNAPRVFLESIDLATGETVEIIPIQTQWGDIEVGAGIPLDLSVDLESWRVLVSLAGRKSSGELMRTVVLVDRYTGTQALLYDGRPARDGSKLACASYAALDRQAGRLLLREPLNEYWCPGNTFAIDLATGAFTRL